MGSRTLFVALAACLFVTGTAGADVLTLKDGRVFEGHILGETDAQVAIDAMVGSIRATVTFPKDEVKSMEKKDLPAGFFAPPPADPRVSSPDQFTPDQSLYLEVPIIGEIGKQVLADGIASALSYARRHRIRHVVFHIDSEGGDLDETIQIYKVLKRHERHLSFHAVIKKCLGNPLAVAVWCDTVNLLPGAVAGGLGRKASDMSDKVAADEEEIVRARVTHKILNETGITGKHARIVSAMLNPSESIAAWKGEDGAIQMGTTPPEGTEAIFSVDDKTPLQITYEQCMALGMPACEGGVGDLGKVLKIEGWTAESDYGVKAMAKVAEKEQKRAAYKQAIYEKKVKKNLARRETIEESIGDSIKNAAAWDPTRGSYETYSYHWNWGWGWSESWDSKKWTTESQKRWKTRTDACIHFLRKAGKGLTSMKRLDKEAQKLGLEPTFGPGKIDAMLKDIKVKLVALAEHRDRSGE
jgi:ATP-dependent protease ClpP protease subunit